MTEKSKISVKRKIFRGIVIFLRWVFILLLAVLLAGGLYFQGPWKITVLVAVLFIGVGVLPRRWRRYFYVTVACVVLAVVVWVLVPEDNSGWRPYTLNDELAAFNANNSVPNENNAAGIYAQIAEENEIEQFRIPMSIDIETEKLLRSEPWKEEDYPEICDIIAKNESVLEQLVVGGERDTLFIEKTITDRGIDLNMEVFGTIRMGINLLAVSSCRDFALGDVEGALKKNRSILKIGRQFQQSQVLLDKLVGCGVENYAIDQLYSFIIECDLDQDQMQYIDSYLGTSSGNWTDSWGKIMEFEKMFARNESVSFNYEINENGNIRLSRLKGLYASLNFLLDADQYSDSKLHALIKWFYIPSSPDRMLEIVDSALKEYDEFGRSDYNWNKKIGPAFIDLMLNESPLYPVTNFKKWVEEHVSTSCSSFHRVHGLFLKNRAKRNVVRVCLGLKMFRQADGDWPSSLDMIKPLMSSEMLVDPTNGMEYVYNRVDDGFVLYSKGGNGIDENGKSFITNIEYTVEDDILFWPPEYRDHLGVNESDADY